MQRIQLSVDIGRQKLDRRGALLFEPHPRIFDAPVWQAASSILPERWFGDFLMVKAGSGVVVGCRLFCST